MLRLPLAARVCALTTMSTFAGTVQPREGWKVFDTKLTFTTLVQKLDVAVNPTR